MHVVRCVSLRFNVDMLQVRQPSARHVFELFEDGRGQAHSCRPMNMPQQQMIHMDSAISSAPAFAPQPEEEMGHTGSIVNVALRRCAWC